MKVDNAGEENTNNVDEKDLIDYNDIESEVPAAEKKAAKKLALRKMLAQNGFALRTVLMDEHVKAHYVSPIAKENEMSGRRPTRGRHRARLHIYASELCSKVISSRYKSAQGTSSL
jgi:hypothetical protein